MTSGVNIAGKLVNYKIQKIIDIIEYIEKFQEPEPHIRIQLSLISMECSDLKMISEYMMIADKEVTI